MQKLRQLQSWVLLHCCFLWLLSSLWHWDLWNLLVPRPEERLKVQGHCLKQLGK